MKKERIYLRMTSELKKEIEEKAASHGIPVTSYITMLIKKDLTK
jgi:predicted DNA binding CopG/RHH family protein